MHMIGKLSKNQKAHWPKHWPELVHAYNSMRVAITGYSPHYLMFQAPTSTYPLTSISPHDKGYTETSKHQHVDHYITELHEWLQEAFKEAQSAVNIRGMERQKWHYDRKANAISLEPGDLILAKADAYRGEGEGSVGGGTIWSGTPICERNPFLPHEKSVDRMLTNPPPKLTFPHCSDREELISVWLCKPSRFRYTTTYPRRTNSGGEWDSGSITKCKLSESPAQHQTG